MENLSVILWTELCRFIGTLEQVFIRRKWSLFEDKACKQYMSYRKENFIHIESGSRSEGLRLPGSDIDTTLVYTAVSVLPALRRQLHQPDLIMETENVKPGFVRLRTTAKLRFSRRFLDCIRLHGGVNYMSSQLFSCKVVRIGQEGNPDAVLHGPCMKDISSDNIERDVAVCFACRVWPDTASEWIQRHRPNNWPPGELIQGIVSGGCMIVPIGNPNSELKDIEWRISFSVAERKLAYSMNHTQFLCYGLLKLYLKHVIESDDSVKDLLCSYFLKTCIFYCIEDCDIRWAKENLINCFWACFRRLISWVRNGFCPNYFIKDNNMFEGKLFGDKQTRLLGHLLNLYSDGINTFVLIPCLRDLITHYQDSFVENRISDFHTSDIQLECLIDIEIFSQYILGPILVVDKVDISSSKDIMLWISTVEKQRVSSSLDLALKTCCLSNHKLLLSQTLYQEYVYKAKSNKDKYKYVRMVQNFIVRECTGGDICTGWLQYATLCYITGQYNTVIHIVQHVLNKFKPYAMYRGFGKHNFRPDAYSQEICGRGLTVLQKVKQTLSSAYQIIPKLSCCFSPREIESEIMNNSQDVLAYIPPIVYSNVLLFLSYKVLRHKARLLYTLNKLHIAVESDQFVTELERPIAKSLLDICVQLKTNECDSPSVTSCFKPVKKYSLWLKDCRCDVKQHSSRRTLFMETDKEKKICELPNTVLKRNHSLKGKNLLPLQKRLKNYEEPRAATCSLAKLSTQRKTEDLTDTELAAGFEEITGDMASKFLERAGRDNSIENLQILLHIAIIYANEVGQPGDALSTNKQSEQDDEEIIQQPMPKKRKVEDTDLE